MRIRWVSLISLISATVCSATEFSDTRTIDRGLFEGPGFLVNSQGYAQHDISIRGSSYAGAGITVNGLNLKVPYSRHFGTELPFLSYLFSEPEAQHGLINSAGHLVGSAAYSTQPQETHLQADLEVGTTEQIQAGVAGFSSGVGGYINGHQAHSIDYDANDLERISGGAHAQHSWKDWQLDLLGGIQQKTFGAQGYYGVPSTVYAEEETRDALALLSATTGDRADSFAMASATWRQFDDLYRIPTSAFESDVRSDYGAVVLEGRTLEVQHIALNLRGDLEVERVSGTIGNHDRMRAAVLLMPEVRFDRFTMKAGLNSVFQTDESAEWLPLAGVDWFAGDNSTVSAAYTETVQQPDYQTRYYADPYRLGNPLLAQQRSQNAEIGFRQFLSANLDWKVGGFYRRLHEASDWVKQTALSPQWVATDLGTLDVAGLDAAIHYQSSENLALDFFYQWVKKDEFNYYSGLYELDYPEHLLTFTTYWKFLDEFAVEYLQHLRYQTPNNYRTSDNFGTDASLGLHYFPRYANNVRLSFRVDDLWASNFQAIPGLDQPPTTYSAGITVAW
jgi:vitamin B12 transporter